MSVDDDFNDDDEDDLPEEDRAAIARLSERDRDLIHRRYYQEQSYRQIADALGLTVNHVGVALFRAESRLKLILKKHHACV